jgi:hypothetical protein
MYAPDSQKSPSREDGRPHWKIDYVAFLQEARNVPGLDVLAVLKEDLPYAFEEPPIQIPGRNTCQTASSFDAPACMMQP